MVYLPSDSFIVNLLKPSITVACLIALCSGCQTLNRSNAGVANTSPQSNVSAAMLASKSSPAAGSNMPILAADPTAPQPSPASQGAMTKQIAPQSGFVAQAAYQSVQQAPSLASGYAAATYDPAYQRVPMPMMPGTMPIAANPNAVHTGGCACCRSGMTTYQPVYATNDSCSNGCNACATMPYCPPTNYRDPQEYIYDGGDQSPAVRIRDDYSLAGLGPEDTVVQFTTEDGREFAETGCRAAIYAPRFASLRRVTSYRQRDGVLAARAALKEEPAGLMNAPLPPTVVADLNKVGREDAVGVIEAYRDRNRGVPLLANQTPLGWSGVYQPYENLELIRTGIWNTVEGVAVKRGTAAAAAWTSVDELMVLVDNKQLEIVQSDIHPQELLTYELGGARIRMCKVASQQSADVGDVVDFTIRFDNIAEQTLSSLVIHDSLPPRLEYVLDSQQSSFDADFETVPNEIGSEILRWKLKAPIKPGQGGIIRFKSKVR